MSQPRLSIVTYLHSLTPAAERALFSLSEGYQRGVRGEEYEILLVVDATANDHEALHRLAPNVRVIRFAREYAPAWEAINFGVGEARTPLVVCCTDGERILSPGALRYFLAALGSCSHPLVYALDLNAEIPTHGGGEPWRENGYLLFGSVEPSSRTPRGFFSRVQESSCFGMKKRHYIEFGGIDERFRLPCGGLGVADLFDRVEQDKRFSPILLLGEAAFRQGGTGKRGLGESCREEYLALRGRHFDPVYRRPSYYGWVCSDYHADLLSEPEAANDQPPAITP